MKTTKKEIKKQQNLFLLKRENRNRFQLLNIKPTVNKKEIKAAYLEKAKEHHPDKKGDPESFKEIVKAYEGLMNELKQVPIIRYIDAYLKIKDFLKGCWISFYEGEKLVEIYIPPLTEPKKVVRYENHRLTGLVFYVTLHEDDDISYKRERKDIYLRKNITKKQAIEGIDLHIVNFDETEINVSIPKNTTASSLIYEYEGLGFFDNKKRRGMLTVVINIEKEE